MNGARTKLLWVSLVAVSLALCGAGCQEKTAEAPLELTVAMNKDMHSGLILVAQEQGFFEAQGLRVKFNAFDSGYRCMKQLAGDNADMATGADLGFVGFFNADPPLRIVASIASFAYVDIVTSKGKRITAPDDLQGKRIGVPAATGALYSLESFLHLNGIPLNAVTMVDIPPAELPQALTDGRVDAICVWGQFAWLARKRLGDSAVAWPAQNSQYYHWVLAVRDTAGDDREGVQRFLRALLQAQKFMLSHPGPTQASVSKRLQYSDDYIQAYWKRTIYGVTLGQSLVDSLENAARWRLAKAEEPYDLPNVLKYIDPRPLSAVDEQAVTIYR